MKLNTMTKILVCGVSVMFLLSFGACQIKSAGVQVETDTELKAEVSRAIKKYIQENGDAPRSFDLLKGKYLDEKTYERALEKNMKYTYIGKGTFLLSPGACQIKSEDVHIETDTELKAKISKAIRIYRQENGDVPRSFDQLRGKYLDEKTYKWALARNIKYKYVGKKSYSYSMSPKPKGGPPAHAPAHGYRAKHLYRYYPSCYVYFDVSRKCYFYLAGNGWRVSASLPVHMRAQLGDYVSIEMDTDRPYTRFQEHKKKYPPRQLKKKKKKRWS